MKKIIKIVCIVLILLLISVIFFPKGNIPISDHYDGKTFHNKIIIKRGIEAALKVVFFLPFKKEKWPDKLPVVTQKPVIVSKDKMAITFINHASFFIQLNGMNILTDPIFSKRASPFSWVGPQRVRSPGIKLEDLPKIDVILISHNHYDHLDMDTIKGIISKQQDKPPIILTGLGNKKLFTTHKIQNVFELDWDQKHNFKGMDFWFLEARHRSGRGLFDQNKTLWGAFLIKSLKTNIFFAGDTGYSPHFKEIGKKYGNMDISLLPIGSYAPQWFMQAVHLNPKEALQAHRDLKSRKSIAMHYGTFQLSYEKESQPLKDLEIAMKEKKVSNKEFMAMNFGDTSVFSK